MLLLCSRSLLLQYGSMNEYMLIVFVLVISVIAYFVVCASTSLTENATLNHSPGCVWLVQIPGTTRIRIVGIKIFVQVLIFDRRR